MSSSLSICIAYGYNLEGGSCSWALKEDPETYSPIAGPWFDPDSYDDDFLSAALREFLTQRGVQVPKSADAYDLGKMLEQNSGLTVEDHGWGDAPQQALVTFSKTTYDAISIIHPEQLHSYNTGEWDRQLAEFITTLGIIPLQTRPEWLVLASYG